MKSNNLLVFKCLCHLLIFHRICCIGLGKLGTPPIADFMSINKYKKLGQYLHFRDNSKIDDTENKKSKLYKIEPVIDHVRNNCCTI